MAARYYTARSDAFDGNGAPRAGAKLYFYEAGTSTPKDTYSDAALATPNANPVVADANGVWGDIFMAAAEYKVVLKTSADVTVWTADNFTPPTSITAASQAQVDARTSALVAVTPATIAEGVGLQGSSISSAAALNIPDVGDYFPVTGSTGPITSLESRTAGREIELVFASTPTITHNATSLIMPGSEDYTCVAGDVLRFRSEGSGNWRCVGINLPRATQAQMEAATSVATVVTPGRVKHHPGVAKAWGVWDNAGSIAGTAYNITSITDTAAGSHTVNFTVAFSSANYVPTFIGSTGASGILYRHGSKAAGTCPLVVRNLADSAGTDPDAWNAAFFGDQ